MRKVNFGLAAATLFLANTAIASGECGNSVRHVFARGETLSQILVLVNGSQLWGAKGLVAHVVAKQPAAFHRSRFGHVLAGAEVELPVQFCPKRENWHIENGFLANAPALAPAVESAPVVKPAAEVVPADTPTPKPTSIPTPTPAPTPVGTPLPETEFQRTMQSGDTGYSKILDSLAKEQPEPQEAE